MKVSWPSPLLFKQWVGGRKRGAALSPPTTTGGRMKQPLDLNFNTLCSVSPPPPPDIRTRGLPIAIP